MRQLYFVDHTSATIRLTGKRSYWSLRRMTALETERPEKRTCDFIESLIGKITDQLSDVSAGINPVETRNSVTTDAQDGSVDGGKGG